MEQEKELELEYRIVDFELEGVRIESKPFDFGCSAIVQDNLKAAEINPSIKENFAKFASKLVETVLYRMLEGKIRFFNDVKKLSPSITLHLFEKFTKWYKEDLDYLSRLMTDATIEGVLVGGKTILHAFFEHHNTDPEVMLSWKFETVALLLYMAKRKSVADYLKEHPMN
jgi:hypothetical protein